MKLARFLDTADRKALIASSVFAPFLLFTTYLVLRGLSFHGTRPPFRILVLPLVISPLIGAIPLWCAPYSSFAKLGFMLLYIFMYGMLLLLYGTVLSCFFFFDCD